MFIVYTPEYKSLHMCTLFNVNKNKGITLFYIVVYINKRTTLVG